MLYRFTETIPQISWSMNVKRLTVLGINYDNWFSEKQLHENGKIDQVIQKLDKAGHLIIKDSAHGLILKNLVMTS